MDKASVTALPGVVLLVKDDVCEALEDDAVSFVVCVDCVCKSSLRRDNLLVLVLPCFCFAVDPCCF